MAFLAYGTQGRVEVAISSTGQSYYSLVGRRQIHRCIASSGDPTNRATPTRFTPWSNLRTGGFSLNLSYELWPGSVYWGKHSHANRN